MKKFLFLVLLLASSAPDILKSQTLPQGFNYQAIIREMDGDALPGTPVAIYFSILDGSPGGAVIYAEKHLATTNEFGLLNLIVGQGTLLSGDFATINWGASAKFLRVEADVNNSGNIATLGVSQLMSVPYALYAGNASGGDNWGSQTAQSDATLAGNGLPATPLKMAQQGASLGQVLKWDGSTWAPAADDISAGDDWGLQTAQTDATLAGNGTAASPLKLDSQGATSNQVLKWTGSTWVPAEDNWGSQFVQTNATLTGSGLLASPLRLAQQGATAGQVLKWNGAIWTPANDVGGGSGDDWGTQTAQTDATLSGNGTAATPLKLAAQGASSGQILKWNGSSWAPAADNGQSYTAGTGITITGNTINSTWTKFSNNIFSNNPGTVSIGHAPQSFAKLCVQDSVQSFYVGYFRNAHANSNLPALYAFSNSTFSGPSVGNGGNALYGYMPGPGFGDYSAAVRGLNANTAQTATGVLGQQTGDGVGVYGRIVGTGSTNVGNAGIAGVVGEISSTSAGSGSCGVKGLNRGTGISGVGVQGAQFGNGWGVWGWVSGTTSSARAIYGQSSSEQGYGGYFLGRVKIEKHPITVSPYLEIPAANWDLQNTQGDFKIGDATYALKMGVATSGGGAGDCYILAKGGTDRLFLGTSSYSKVLTIEGRYVTIGPNGALRIDQNGDLNDGLTLIRDNQTWEFSNTGNTSSGRLWLNSNFYGVGNFDAVSGEYYYVSDARLKKNIQPMGDVLPVVMQLQPRNYGWKNDTTGTRSIGFIAQDVQKLFPELIYQNQGKNDCFSMNYAGFSVLAIKAIQEQQALIESQNARIGTLEKDVEELKSLLNALVAKK